MKTYLLMLRGKAFEVGEELHEREDGSIVQAEYLGKEKPNPIGTVAGVGEAPEGFARVTISPVDRRGDGTKEV